MKYRFQLLRPAFQKLAARTLENSAAICDQAASSASNIYFSATYIYLLTQEDLILLIVVGYSEYSNLSASHKKLT